MIRAFLNKLWGRTEPVGAERAAKTLQTRYNPLRQLDPQSLGRVLDDWAVGRLREGALLWEAARRRDEMVVAVEAKRIAAVAQLDWQVVPVDDSPEAAAHAEALREIYDGVACTSLVEQDERGGMRLLVSQMAEAIGARYAVHELTWARTATGLRLAARRIPLHFFERTQGRLRLLRDELALAGEELEAGRWLVSVGPGLFEATLVAYLFKRLSLQDWVGFCEKFGWPFPLGKTAARQGSPEWAAMVKIISEFRNDGGAVMSSGNSLELVKSDSAGTLPFPGLVERMDRAIAILWRGGDLGTMAMGQDAVGSQAQAGESDALLRADAGRIQETLWEWVERPAIAALFGAGTTPLAFLELQVPQRVDATAQIAITEHLVKHGVPVSQQEAASRLGRTIAAEGEAVLRAPVVVAPPPGVGPGQPGTAGQPGQPEARENRRRLANRAVVAGAAERLRAASEKTVATALTGHLEKLRGRLAAVLEAEPTERRARLEALRADLPGLVDWGDAGLVRAFEAALAPGLLNGLTSREELPAGADNARRGYHDLRDDLGRFAPGPGGGDPDPIKNERLGRLALRIAERRGADVKSAMFRAGIGVIDFEEGTPGETAEGYRGGHGLAHIRAKHAKDYQRIPRMIARGTVQPNPRSPDKWEIVSDFGTVSVARRGAGRAAIITGYSPKL